MNSSTYLSDSGCTVCGSSRGGDGPVHAWVMSLCPAQSESLSTGGI